jgi:uncharacterized protein (DUF433 family)
MQPLATQHIEMRQSAIHGEKACIVGTRISVQDIYIWHELLGKSPDEIVSEYPFLTLSQVHAALAYFYDHAEEIREQIKRGRDEVERVRANNPPKLQAKVADMDANGDSVSS